MENPAFHVLFAIMEALFIKEEKQKEAPTNSVSQRFEPFSSSYDWLKVLPSKLSEEIAYINKPLFVIYGMEEKEESQATALSPDKLREPIRGYVAVDIIKSQVSPKTFS